MYTFYFLFFNEVSIPLELAKYFMDYLTFMR